MAKPTRTKVGARTALERQQLSRERTSHAYSRARNAAEREVTAVMTERHSSVYDAIKAAVEAEVPDIHRAVRQSRVRSAAATWYRSQHPKKWDAILDRHIAEVTTGTSVVIRRRRTA